MVRLITIFTMAVIIALGFTEKKNQALYNLVEEVNWGRSACLRDPEGRLIELTQ